MNKLIYLLGCAILISGCSTKDTARAFCQGGDETMALLCLSSVATAHVLNKDERSGPSCSEMSGIKKDECEAQVRKLKEHLNNRTKKGF